MQFEAYATRLEPIDTLFVQADTLGRAHQIQMADGLVVVKLPALTETKRVALREHLTAHDDPSIGDSEFSKWQALSQAGPDTTWFETLFVDVRVDLNAPVQFEGSESDFNGLPVLRSRSAERSFQAVLRAMDGALDIWKRTLRWISLSPSIAFSDVSTRNDATRGAGFNLFRKADDALFRGHGGMIKLVGGGKVSREAWAVAQRALADGVRPPIWIDFLMEAHRRSMIGDLRGAIVNAAVASETAIRNAFQATLPVIESPIAARLLDTTSVQGLLTGWETISGWDKAQSRKLGKSQVHELLDLRNAVMHRGLDTSDELIKIQQLLPPVSAFILACDADDVSRRRSDYHPVPIDRAFERLTEVPS